VDPTRQRNKAKGGVPLRDRGGVGPGPKFGMGRLGARGLRLFFCSFPFLFLFSCLFHNFCKIDPNQIKPIPKFL
jgi:hypothetical protein